MYLLLACSLFAVYIGIERAIFFAQMDAGKAFANKFYTYMKFHKAAQAKQLAADSNGGLPLILNDVFEGQGGRRMEGLYRNAVGDFYLPPSQSSLLFERHRHLGAALGAPRDDQRHDPLVQYL